MNFDLILNVKDKENSNLFEDNTFTFSEDGETMYSKELDSKLEIAQRSSLIYDSNDDIT